jgi:Tol biopolymer transport system component
MLQRTAGAADDKPSWSPSGQEVAFQSTIPSFSANSQIYRKTVDGPPPVPLVLQPHNQFAPDWSPRGDWVAFERDSGSIIQSDLWAYNTSTGEQRRLTYWPSLAKSPAFSPNGQTIAYARYPYVSGNQSADAWELRTIKLDGTGDSPVVSLGTADEFRSIRWSPDGSQIYFTRNDSLFSVSASGGEPNFRGDLIPKATSFDLHPSGWRLLAEEPKTFRYTQCGAPQINLLMRRVVLRNVPNRDSETRFYRTGAEFFNPRWSPEGTRIAYVSDQNSPGDRDLFTGQVSYNHAPTFTPPPRDTVLVLPCGSYTFAFDLGATDLDGETITYEAANLPPGATLAANHFSWVNPSPPGKDCYVAFRAVDGRAGWRARW